MECQQVQRRISAYLDGELDAAAMRNMESHLEGCAACKEMAADFERVDAMVRGLPRLDVGAEFIPRLLDEVGRPTGTGASERRSRFPLAPLKTIASTFMDLLEERSSIGTHTLDEFGDFPPCSIGYIYLKLLNQTVRG
jgi:anti-sigma factor RsiW